MVYGSVFTIYSLFFLILLLFTFFLKVKKITLQKKLFILVIASSVIFSLEELISVFIFTNINQSHDLFTILWKGRMVSIFFNVTAIILYYDVLINGEIYPTIMQTILKRKKNLFFMIFIILFSIFYCVVMPVVEHYPDAFLFLDGLAGYIIMVIVFLAGVYLLFVAISVRKTRRNIFNCFLIIFVLLMIASPLQMIFRHVSFMPFLSLFICYVFYYNIENPDIELLNDVSNLKMQIDKSNNAKTDFLFNLSYDLVTPINSIFSLSESITTSQNIDKDALLDDIKSIKLIGNTLLDSINNVFEMSIDGGNVTKEYNLYELVSRLRSVVDTRIGAKQIKFEMNLDNNLSSKYIGDINKIQKVLLNILGNAVKFTDVGKIILSVNFSVEKDYHILHFKIMDTGNGIKDEEKSFVFNDSESDKTGVGLAISKKYIEEMNGSIRFDSVYGGGTTFYIDLPQKVSGSRLISDDLVNENNNGIIEYTNLSNYKVLIVDDDNLDIKVTKRLLEKYNLQIEVCKSTVEFIDKIKCDEEYDLVFLDHKMSELDGVETVKLLRKLEGYKLPKISCLTANAVGGARDFYLSNGFDEYLSKPIDIHELDRIIKKFCKNR